MEFNNRLYELRKRKGLSQEELANKLNVSRQTVSKWESEQSTPDVEKIILLSDLFEVTLDELVTGKVIESHSDSKETSEVLQVVEEKVLTEENKKKAKKWLKIAGIILGIFVGVDMISMIIYFVLYGVPG